MKSNFINKTVLLSNLVLFIVFVFTLQSCKEENQPPVVQISVPTNGEVIIQGDVVTISAEADDVDDDIKEVRFYVDNVGIGAATGFPYNATWSTVGLDAGTYTIKVTVEDDEGQEATDEIQVVVELPQIPVVGFEATPAACPPGTVIQFSDTSLNRPTVWLWDFGDGSVSTLQNPTKSYDDYGEYNVTLTVSNGAGADSEVKRDYIIIIDAPVASFDSYSTSGYLPLKATFESTSTDAVFYYWDFGDGTTSYYDYATHTYEDEGVYDVMLVVSNEYTSDTLIKRELVTVMDPFQPGPDVTDVDGNTYKTVRIGDQYWMAENLKVTHYPNGVAIPHIENMNEWENLEDDNTGDAYCYVHNNPDYGYGILYTYAAAVAHDWENDNYADQGICPDGWHLPTDYEWRTLEGRVDTHYPIGSIEWSYSSYRGYDVGLRLKSEDGWAYNGSGNNASGFDALPGGWRRWNGEFREIGSYGYWWTSTDPYNTEANIRIMSYEKDGVKLDYSVSKQNGFSVRCVKDVE